MIRKILCIKVTTRVLKIDSKAWHGTAALRDRWNEKVIREIGKLKAKNG